MFAVVRLRRLLPAGAVLLFVSLIIVGSAFLRYTESVVSAAASEIHTGVPLIIDAGHGGLDGGAVGIDGTVESMVNLDIATKLHQLAGLFGYESIMTRESEQLQYPEDAVSIAAKKAADQRARVELIRSCPGTCMISIHQNTYPAPSVHGAQVFYRKTAESQALAERIQSDLNLKLLENGRRLAAPISEDIFLMKSIDCTAVLIECGFLSNPAECAKLADADYRTKLALTVFSAWTTERQNWENLEG